MVAVYLLRLARHRQGAQRYEKGNSGASAVARGIFGGLIVGTVVSGLVIGVASVMTGLPGEQAPQTTALDVPAGSEFDQAREDTEATLPQVEETTSIADTPQVETGQPDDLSSMSDDATQPAALPQTGVAEGDLSAPQVAAESGDLGLDTDSPVLLSPEVVAPEAPTDEENLSISTDPAQPAVPQVEEETAAFPEQETASMPDDIVVDDPVVESDIANEDATMEDAGEAVTEETVEIPTVPEEEPSSTIGNLAEGVATGRLPSVTDEPEVIAEDTAEIIEVETPALPAIQANAAVFENPDDKPLMSIVLIDDGSSPIGLTALASFPYPLSFAVDSGWSGAGAAMKGYRDAGFEVLALANLPEGAQPSDTEIAMQTILAAVPEAVAIMEGTGSGLQSNRDAAEQLAPILLETGHGLLLFPNGLDTAQKLISREGVPAETVFRDFDAKGQSATVIRRFLDQAALKAGRGETGVIMVGRLRADTISALLLWGLQDRASRVALAPISAVLTEE